MGLDPARFVVSFQVNPDNVRRLKNPGGFGDSFYALCPVEEIANGRDLPLEKTNPREQKLGTSVARDIATSLRRRDGKFHMLNRGITISVAEADYDNKKERLRLVFEDDDTHGIIDGGHTYRIIRSVVGSPKDWPADPDGRFYPQFVRLEVLTKVDRNLLLDLAEARNTSVQVDEASLTNLAEDFAWLKEELRDYEHVIRYKQFGHEPVSVRDVIALLTLFNIDLFDANNHPIVAYTSKAKCLRLFKQKPETYKKLRPVMHDILRMYDFMRSQAKERYNKDENGKFERWSFIDNTRNTPLYYWKGTDGRLDHVKYHMPDGLVLPALASLRFLLKRNGDSVCWKVPDIFQFWSQFGAKHWRIVFETCSGLGSNPNATGKNLNLWLQLYDKVQAAYVGLLNVDLEQVVSLGKTTET